MDEALHQELIGLILQNQQILAVQLYQTRTGQSLATAKAVVDDLRRQMPPAAAVSFGANPYSASLEQEIESLVYSGQKVQAVKMVRQATGGNLAEAKAFVDSVEARVQNTAVNLSGTGLEQEVLLLINQGKTAEAIQLTRKTAGVGLSEAKMIVGELTRKSGSVVRQPTTLADPAAPWAPRKHTPNPIDIPSSPAGVSFAKVLVLFLVLASGALFLLSNCIVRL